MLKFFVVLVLFFASLAGLILGGGGILILSTPRPTGIRGCFVTKMYQVRLCPTEPGYVRTNEVSPFVKMAVVASEDTAFYDHQGIDWNEMHASFQRDLEEGRFARGGSTITQQLAKNLYLSKEKSVWRKLKETLIAVQIEKILKKDEILEKYLNVVEFGPNLYGISKASQFYFHKTPLQLNLQEGTFIAFLLPNPKKYSASFRNGQLTKFASSQLREILGRLLHFHKISQDDYDVAVGRLPTLFKSETAKPAVLESDDPSLSLDDDLATEPPPEP